MHEHTMRVRESCFTRISRCLRMRFSGRPPQVRMTILHVAYTVAASVLCSNITNKFSSPCCSGDNTRAHKLYCIAFSRRYNVRAKRFLFIYLFGYYYYYYYYYYYHAYFFFLSYFLFRPNGRKRRQCIRVTMHRRYARTAVYASGVARGRTDKENFGRTRKIGFLLLSVADFEQSPRTL
jgi:hypothetical protein